MFNNLLLSLFYLFYYVNYVDSILKNGGLRNDKFLDYVDFVPLKPNRYSSFHPLHYSTSIRPKSLLNSTNVPSTILEKRKQKEILTKLIDSIQFDTSADHQVGKLKSADEIAQLVHKYGGNRIELSAYRLDYLGTKMHEKRKFNHYIVIKKRIKKMSEHETNRNAMIDNSLFYTYQNVPALFGPTAFDRLKNSKFYDPFNRMNNTYLQSKSLSIDNDQFVFCSVFVQRNVKFGRKAIRIAFVESMKNNLNESPFNSMMQQNRVHNIWLTDGLKPFTTLRPIERLHTISGLGMLYKNV